MLWLKCGQSSAVAIYVSVRYVSGLPFKNLKHPRIGTNSAVMKTLKSSNWNQKSWFQLFRWKLACLVFVNTHFSLLINEMRQRQIYHHLANNILKWIFLKSEWKYMSWSALKISPLFVPKVLINNIPALVQIMAWRRPGDKPLSEPTIVSLLMHRSHSASMASMEQWNSTASMEQGKSEGFDSCDRPGNLTQIGFKSSIFQPVWPWNLMDDPPPPKKKKKKNK